MLFDYSATIDASQLSVTLNTLQSPSLSQIAPFSLSFKAIADDNQALYFYSANDYLAAEIAEYTALVLGIAALVLLVLGVFGGRLVGL